MNIREILTQPEVHLIDVREPYEVMMGGIDGAVNIPLGTIPERFEEISKLNGPIVLFCMSGNRSGQAVQYLKHNGVENTYNGGGIGDMKWMMDSLNVGG